MNRQSLLDTIANLLKEEANANFALDWDFNAPNLAKNVYKRTKISIKPQIPTSLTFFARERESIKCRSCHFRSSLMLVFLHCTGVVEYILIREMITSWEIRYLRVGGEI